MYLAVWRAWISSGVTELSPNENPQGFDSRYDEKRKWGRREHGSPRRPPVTVWTVLESRQTQQLFQFCPIESNHCLTIDEGDRGRPESHFDQLVERGLVGPNILCNELHAFARKKLFLLVATASPWLRVHHHLLGHGLLRVKVFRPSVPLPILLKRTIRDWGDTVNGRAVKLSKVVLPQRSSVQPKGATRFSYAHSQDDWYTVS